MKFAAVLAFAGLASAALDKNCARYCNTYLNGPDETKPGCQRSDGLGKRTFFRNLENEGKGDALENCILTCEDFPDVPACASDNTSELGCSESRDSFQCREYHINVATSADDDATRDTHCAHGSVISQDILPENLNGPCISGPTFTRVVGGVESEVNILSDNPHQGQCDNYCDAVANTCGSFSAGKEACMGFCRAISTDGQLVSNKFPKQVTDLDANMASLVCRRYHLTVAAGLEDGAEDKDYHCGHATLGGGVCGNTCDAYCKTALATCSSTFANLEECTEACEAFDTVYPEDDGRDFTAVKQAYKGGFSDLQDNLECRFYHLTVATTLDVERDGTEDRSAATTHCEHINAESSDPANPNPCISGASSTAVSAATYALAVTSALLFARN